MATARGIINNNPGNLVRTYKKSKGVFIPYLWKGEVPHSESSDKTFKQFYTMNEGLQALMRNLITYINSGNNTITKILDKWDPPPDDNTNYKNYVTKSTGYGAYRVLPDRSGEITRLTRAIVDFENGPNNITNSQIEKAYGELGRSPAAAGKKNNVPALIGTALVIGFILKN